MLNVTEPAAIRLVELLGAPSDESVLRLVRRKRWLRLRRDQARPEDARFAHGGRLVLVLDEQVAQSLDSRTLDIRQTDTGPRLRLQPR